MARILCLCSRLPYPLTGGAKVRLYNTARLLGTAHDVELLVIEDETAVEETAVSTLASEFEDVTVFSFPTRRFYLNALRGLVSDRPLQSQYYHFDSVSSWIQAHQDRYDLFYCNHVRTTEYVRGRDIPKVVDLVDAISMNYRDRPRRGVWRAILPIETRRLERYEREVVQEFDRTFITSPVDKSAIESEEITVIPNGVKESFLSVDFSYTRSDPPALAFLGKMDYQPNIDAVRWFVESVFPAIRSETGADFKIVGSQPTEDVQRLSDTDGVEVTGFVEQPAAELAESDLFVAPMRHGAGVQNKVLEAMAAGMPIVASKRARQGIDVKAGVHLRLADSPEEYVDEIMDLLSDADDRERLGRNARGKIEEQYTWEAAGETLRSQLDAVLENAVR